MLDCYQEDCGKVEEWVLWWIQNSMSEMLSRLVCLVEKLDETDLGDCDTWALYDTQYPVIYLNKYTITHPESFY